MKLVKEHINEGFERSEDKLSSVGVGKIVLIKRWIEELKYEQYIQRVVISEITINDDFTFDTKNSLMLPDDFGDFPDFIQFNKCGDDFNCRKSNITSLKGAPKFVVGDYICCDNPSLSSLKYGPKKVIGNLICSKTSIPKNEILDLLKKLHK